MSAVPEPRTRPSEAVAGFAAALAIFASVIGVAWHPLRLIPVSIVIALIATAMGGRHTGLARAAVIVGAVCFFLGMTIAIISQRPLW
jgi:uncharacterized membrane protein YtjA (UPF0391 family)